MEIKFKAMVETETGAKYDFNAMAGLTDSQFDALVKRLVVENGYTLPVEPVLEIVPEAPEATIKTYYSVKFEWKPYNTETPHFCFEDPKDAQAVVDAIMGAAGKVHATGYGEDKIRQGVLDNGGVESFAVKHYTDEDKRTVERIKDIVKRNEAASKEYRESCGEIEKTRQWLSDQSLEAYSIKRRVDELVNTFISTNAVVEDANKTLVLLTKNHGSAMQMIAEQLEDYSEETDKAMAHNLGVVGQYIINLAESKAQQA